jgi:hypothetical protein
MILARARLAAVTSYSWFLERSCAGSRRNVRGTFVVAALALAVCPRPAAAADRTLATRQPETIGPRAYGGVAIFSRWNGRTYKLFASVSGRRPRPLRVPAQDEPFDADIGPDADGRPTVVLTRCAAGACGLSLLALTGSAPVATGIAVPTAAVHPTVWRGTIAWLDGTVIRTQTGTVGSVSANTAVIVLELHGSDLALNVARDLENIGVCGQREVQLLNTRSGAVRVLGTQACGLNGQSFYGPTFAGGWLYFARSCNLDCGSARYGAYRYRLRDGRYEIAGDGRPLQDWAWGGGGTAYQLRARSDVGCSDNRVACTLIWKNGLRFKRVGAPIHA